MVFSNAVQQPATSKRMVTIRRYGVLTESPRYVILGPFISWFRENFFRPAIFDDLAQEKKYGFIGYARRLLHVVGNNDHGVFRF